jgi:hypothetical protein
VVFPLIYSNGILTAKSTVATGLKLSSTFASKSNEV